MDAIMVEGDFPRGVSNVVSCAPAWSSGQTGVAGCGSTGVDVRGNNGGVSGRPAGLPLASRHISSSDNNDDDVDGHQRTLIFSPHSLTLLFSCCV